MFQTVQKKYCVDEVIGIGMDRYRDRGQGRVVKG